MGDTLRSQTISTKLQEIAEQAARHKDRVFTTLAHLIDEDFLAEAFDRIRVGGAPGVDNVTWAEYAKNLPANLRELHTRLRSGRYVAPAVKRVWIDKEDGKKRPLGIPILEDKVVQKAVHMLLSAIYEQDFHEFSYGFREGRSAHQAIASFRDKVTAHHIQWIVDADVTRFFDTVDHECLRTILKQRVNDGVIIRLIGKWLKAGILEEGKLTYPEEGTPQGGVISPLLANIYLHHVLDDWYVREVVPRMKGRVFLMRYADDFLSGCESKEDADRLMSVLPKRFSRYGLSLHPQKTTLVPFSRPGRSKTTAGGSGTVDFLGFTFYWGKTRQGYWTLKKKTRAKRQARFMKRVWSWCRENRHEPLADQYGSLRSKLHGYYQYYGVRSNYKSLEVVYEYAERAWKYWLSRRSHKGRMTWGKYVKSILEKHPLPKPRIVHAI